LKRINQVEPYIQEVDKKNIIDFLNTDTWVTEHTVTKDFEQKISNITNRKYCVAVPNGTIAIYLALIGAGITKGMRVAVPNLTMIATINAVLWAEAEPILIDVDESLCMSLESLKLTSNLDAVIYVPLNGKSSNGIEIEEYCRNSSILLIEDSAHALGSNYENKNCCSLGDLSILSFTPHKIVTTGQGGMVLTDNEKYYESIFNLKTFNRQKDKTDWHEGFGLNFKFTDLQATLGLSQLQSLEERIIRKKEIYYSYKKLINKKGLNLQAFNEIETPWFYTIEIKNLLQKEKVVDLLAKNNVETRQFYPALSMQKYLENTEKVDLNYSESVFQRLLWLPSSINLSDQDIEFISDLLNSN